MPNLTSLLSIPQQLEADMIVSAIEGFGRSPKSMIPTLAPGEEEEKIGEGGRGGLGGLMRGGTFV